MAVRKDGVEVEAAVGDVFLDADDEVVLRFGFFEVVEDRLGHGRGEFLGAEAVAAADDDRITVEAELAVGHRFADGGAHIQVERLAEGSRAPWCGRGRRSLLTVLGRALMKASSGKGR